ncbi:MAG: calcium/sodium antiporter [Proteobacteria bacterium]|nr:calcium/sodium antiporter [Pseudomonadota bacterium]
MALTILLFLVGLALLLGGAEIMVRGAVALAQRAGLSTLVIGMTIVAFGTSAPELLISVDAVLVGSSGIALGNVVGSNIANIFLVLGFVGLFGQVNFRSAALRLDGVVFLIATLVFAATVLLPTIDRTAGGILLATFFLTFVYFYWRETRDAHGLGEIHEAEAEQRVVPVQHPWISFLLLVGGFAGLIFGAQLLVDSSVTIARSLGVTEAVIGLTLVAFGTSVPELAASAVAAYRKQTDIAVGNIVGSNLFNSLGVMGAASMVGPIEVPARVPAFDIWVMLLATGLLLPFMMTKREGFGRVAAVSFLLLYVAYIAAISLGLDRIV